MLRRNVKNLICPTRLWSSLFPFRERFRMIVSSKTATIIFSITRRWILDAYAKLRKFWAALSHGQRVFWRYLLSLWKAWPPKVQSISIANWRAQLLCVLFVRPSLEKTITTPGSAARTVPVFLQWRTSLREETGWQRSLTCCYPWQTFFYYYVYLFSKRNHATPASCKPTPYSSHKERFA